MSKAATLSTTIDSEIKEALTSYCKRHGLKIRYFIEQALVEHMEDFIDLEAYQERKNEETVDFEDILAQRNKKRK